MPKVKIRVTHPPIKLFFYVENNQTKGLCVDLMEKLLGDKVELIHHFLPVKRIAKYLKSGKIDLVGCTACGHELYMSISDQTIPILEGELIAFFQKNHQI